MTTAPTPPAGCLPRPSRMITIPRDDADALVRAFPTLLRKGCATYAALERAWPSIGCWSHGEQQAARFVRHVMDGTPFELRTAMMVWDAEHRAAFLAWARDPWTGWA
jgi:hypothetical protein